MAIIKNVGMSGPLYKTTYYSFENQTIARSNSPKRRVGRYFLYQNRPRIQERHSAKVFAVC
jgi:hypothetical protein